jgi:hypothetical protein
MIAGRLGANRNRGGCARYSFKLRSAAGRDARARGSAVRFLAETTAPPRVGYRDPRRSWPRWAPRERYRDAPGN